MKCKLAHDLRNGLAIILGECELMAGEAPTGNDEAGAGERLRTVTRVARRMADAIREHECQVEAVLRMPRVRANVAPAPAEERFDTTLAS